MLSDFPAMVSGKVVAVHGDIRDRWQDLSEDVRLLITRSGAVFLAAAVVLAILVMASTHSRPARVITAQLDSCREAPCFLGP